jgi:hypothetical protein
LEAGIVEALVYNVPDGAVVTAPFGWAVTPVVTVPVAANKKTPMHTNRNCLFVIFLTARILFGNKQCPSVPKEKDIHHLALLYGRE